MACKHCKYWQGNRHTKDFADCQRVLFVLTSEDSRGCDRWGNPPSLPFDPHDVQYHLSTSPLHDTLKTLRENPPLGVRVRVVREQAWRLDDHGDESYAAVPVTYIQTHKDFDCGTTDKNTE